MWLIITLIAVIASAAAYLALKQYRKKYKLGLLALMLFGAFLMVLVDHIIAFIGGGAFIEATTDGLIRSSALLGIMMVAAVLIIWLAAVFILSAARH